MLQVRRRKGAFFERALVLGCWLLASTGASTASDVKPLLVSPAPGSALVSPHTTLLLRFSDPLDGSSLSSTLISVVGNKSGSHEVSFVLAKGGTALVLRPRNPFAPGETVSAALSSGIRTSTGTLIAPVSWTFEVGSGQGSMDPFKSLQTELAGIVSGGGRVPAIPSTLNGSRTTTDTLPSDFPRVTLTASDNPAPGKIFICNFSYDPADPTPSYLQILDNTGAPVFYRKMPMTCFDFKVQENGSLTYYDSNHQSFTELDSTYNVVRSIACGNGYLTDIHELRILSDGDALLLAQDYETVDMSKIVNGGNPAAQVIGMIIQEIDPDGNVVFQWRSWDHFKITDAAPDINLNASSIDYVHSNALELDNDGNILLSSRHLDEITKIDRQTGDIIWRLGGKNNQFTFVNDPIGFSHQHCIRRLPSGNVILYDDGNLHVPAFSRACEYALDENGKTATLVWQYRNNPDYYAPAMGSVQRLPNGNTLIGWGATNPTLTEVRPDGSKALELTLPYNIFSYRSFKLPWKIHPDTLGSLVLLSAQELNFGVHLAFDTASMRIVLSNTSSASVAVRSVTNSNTSYYVPPDFPLVLAANSNLSVPVFFKPLTYGTIVDTLSVLADGHALSVVLTGESPLPDLEPVQQDLEFGLIPADSNTEKTVRFVNSALNGVIVDTAYTQTPYFRVARIAPHQVVGQGDSLQLTIAFSPVGNHLYRDTLVVASHNTDYRQKYVLTAGSGSGAEGYAPADYTLLQNYPNPFNPSTTIQYGLPSRSRITIKVYDYLGREISTLVDKDLDAGYYVATWNATASSGLYFCRLDAVDDQSNTHRSSLVRRMVLIK